jgi:uncharacterized protein YbjQ (UPF0145 family)
MRIARLRMNVVVTLGALCLGACTYKGADFALNEADPAAQAIAAKRMKHPEEITVTEDGVMDRRYRVLGKISASERSFSEWLPQKPSREKVNELLRNEAAQQGADAVIKVRYDPDRSVMQQTKLSASGIAIVFVR